MANYSVVNAPSPMPDVMGNFLHDGGCTFRVWALFATGINLKTFNADGTTTLTALAPDSAAGYGTDVWSVFVPGIVAEANYRYAVSFAGASVDRVDPFARSIVYPNWTDASQNDSDARSVVTDRTFPAGPAFQAPGWHEWVIYQMHIGTFFDPSKGGANKIDDLILQIPYLQALGVNVVQFLPFVEFSAPLSLGYDPVLPFAMERDYGSPQDFMRLVQALHGAGMAVMIDVVYNHLVVSTTDTSPPYPYSLYQWDGWGGDPCGIFFYGDDQMDTPWGPRPNYGRPAVTQYLTDNAMLWLEEYQADGLRFDSTICIRKRQGTCDTSCCGTDLGVQRNYGWELMQDINNRIDGDQPWKLTMAEDLSGNAAVTSPTAGGGAGFDAQWDTDLQGALLNALTQAYDTNVDVGAIAQAMTTPFEGDVWKRVIYLESHDQAKYQRVPYKIDPADPQGWFARKKSMLGFAVILTTPGVPMFFQGAELLDTRTWSPGPAPVMMDFTEQKTFSKLFQFYADLVSLRQKTAGLCGGGLQIIEANPTTKMLVYQRWNQGGGVDDLVVVANFTDVTYPSYTIGFPYAGTWHVRFNSDSNDYSDAKDFDAVDSYDTTAGPGDWSGMPCSGNVGIGPYSMIILGR